MQYEAAQNELWVLLEDMANILYMNTIVSLLILT